MVLRQADIFLLNVFNSWWRHVKGWTIVENGPDVNYQMTKCHDQVETTSLLALDYGRLGKFGQMPGDKTCCNICTMQWAAVRNKLQVDIENANKSCARQAWLVSSYVISGNVIGLHENVLSSRQSYHSVRWRQRNSLPCPDQWRSSCTKTCAGAALSSILIGKVKGPTGNSTQQYYCLPILFLSQHMSRSCHRPATALGRHGIPCCKWQE